MLSRIVSRARALPTAVLLASCGPSPIPPPGSGVSWELAQARSRTLSEVRYRIELTIPEIPGEPIRGRTLLLFERSDPENRDLILDFTKPGERVGAVRANGDDVPWRASEDHVVVPSSALSQGPNEVQLEYRAGDDALNRSDDFLYALFVPDRAHFSLPTLDQPDLKATVEWTLTVPVGWKAVANGPEAEESQSGETRTVRFAASRPIPTYLFAFAAGRFEEEREVVDGRAMRMLHRETDTAKVARNRDAIFELHGRALAWLEQYTGIPYPFQKFDFVLIPSFQYGGMEHPGGILYNASGLMLDESPTQGRILGRASVIAHETTHMWFGDLVTMRWFDDVWTKEVFANFMAAKIVHPSFPDLDHDLRFLMAHHPAAYGVDRTPGANAIRQPLENLREAGTLYGAIIYQKAPIVMRQLEARIGEETFREGLREYLGTFAYGNATWPDLVAMLDRRSPEDLAAWSRVWVEEPGRPTVRVRRDGDDVVLEQEDPQGKGRVWPQTLHVLLDYATRDTLVTVELDAEPVRVAGAAAEGLRFALPNGSGVEYGLFLLDDVSLESLVREAHALRSPRTRGAAWVTLWDQVLEGRLAPSGFLTRVLQALPDEAVELNLATLLGYVSRTFWDLLSTEERTRRAAEVEDVLWRGVTSVRPPTARAAFFGAYRSVAISPEGTARLRRLWAGEEELPDLPLSESDHTGLAQGLALREVEGWSGILDEQERRIKNPDRLARFRFVRPSLDADPAVRRSFFESLSEPARREREPWVLDGLENLHHPLRAHASLPLVLPALEMVEEIQRTGDIFFPGRWLDATLGGHNEPEAAETVRRFLDDHPDLPPRLRGKVLQSADGVWRAAGIVHGWR